LLVFDLLLLFYAPMLIEMVSMEVVSMEAV
jgi:hypothetical protein